MSLNMFEHGGDPNCDFKMMIKLGFLGYPIYRPTICSVIYPASEIWLRGIAEVNSMKHGKMMGYRDTY